MTCPRRGTLPRFRSHQHHHNRRTLNLSKSFIKSLFHSTRSTTIISSTASNLVRHSIAISTMSSTEGKVGRPPNPRITSCQRSSRLIPLSRPSSSRRSSPAKPPLLGKPVSMISLSLVYPNLFRSYQTHFHHSHFDHCQANPYPSRMSKWPLLKRTKSV
jgi:hypothetical protein